MGAILNFGKYTDGLNSTGRHAQFMFMNGNIGLSPNFFINTYLRMTLGLAVYQSSPVTMNSSLNHAAIPVPATSDKQLWLAEMEMTFNGPTAGTRGAVTLWDRLSHMGGLIGNVATEQTQNLPTAALTRYTNGEGVQAFFEGHTTFGTLSTTATIRYTNQDGVANQVSKPLVLATANTLAENMAFFCLADGDTGVRSVEGFTMAAAGTSVGNGGIVLMKKIATMPVDTGSYVERQPYRQTAFNGGIVEIMPGAYLTLLYSPSTATTGNWNISGRLGIIEA